MTDVTTAATATQNRVRFLGSFSLELGGQPVTQWRAGKARTLFQYLFMNRGTTVHGDRLREVLWSDEQPRSSSCLKVAAHAVRRVLESQPDATGEVMQLTHRNDGYLLSCGPAWIDLDAFYAAVRDGREAARAGDHEGAIRASRDAMGLYVGDFLAGEHDGWKEDHRQWARNYALIALEELRVDALANGDWAEALHWCRRTLELDPCHESTYQSLMQLHAERGELGRVNDWYEHCCTRLRTQLDLVPSERTERIRSAILGRSRAA